MRDVDSKRRKLLIAGAMSGASLAYSSFSHSGSKDMAVTNVESVSANLGYPPYSSPEIAEKMFIEHVGAGPVKFLSEIGSEIHYAKREGAKVQDAYTGKWYWDCHRNGSLYNLGHRNPKIIAALKEAFNHIEIGNLFLVSGYKAHAAEKLVATTNGDLSGVTWTASGAESTEVAIRAVRGFTKRRKIVSIEGCYHGHTGFAIAAGGSDHWRKRYLLDSDEFVRVPYNDIEAMKQAVDKETAGVIIEASPAQMAFPVPDPGYFKAVSKICRNVGAKTILDEVQTGLGATGTFWYYQQLGFIPDMLTTAKGLGGGLLANAAVLMTQEMKEWFLDDGLPHSSTFGGNELGCVATTTVCDITMAPEFLNNVNQRAIQFKEGLRKLPFKLNQIGLCMGLIHQSISGNDLSKKLFRAGLLTVPPLYLPNSIEFRPVLILNETETEEIIQRIADGLAA